MIKNERQLKPNNLTYFSLVNICMHVTISINVICSQRNVASGLSIVSYHAYYTLFVAAWLSQLFRVVFDLPGTVQFVLLVLGDVATTPK